jgi:multicomponent Na+:H+ antiporter subunit G
VIALLEIAAALCLITGAGFSVLAAVGLVRFPDLYTRIHASSNAGVVGAGLILAAVALVSFDLSVILRSIVAIGFLLLTMPISAHLLSRSTYVAGMRAGDITKTNEHPD